MLHRFEKYALKKQLISPDGKVLAAVSGGLDSVVMARLLAQKGWLHGIAHVNFGLRGADADGDQEFVNGLAQKLNVSFYSTSVNTEKEAQSKGISIQMAARELQTPGTPTVVDVTPGCYGSAEGVGFSTSSLLEIKRR